ncbi:hypothetical protein AAG906_017056 [Vitis piasezkii]
MEQTTLVLKSSAQKLRPYFQAHQIIELMNQPLKSILHKPDLFRRMLKWVIKLTEYEAILFGIDLAFTISAIKLEICNDSQLIVRQIRGEYEAKDERMARYLSKVQANLDRLSEWVANALDGIATTLPIKEAVLLLLYLQVASSIATAPVCSTNEISDNWMNEIDAYIQTGELPEDNKQAHKIRI